MATRPVLKRLIEKINCKSWNFTPAFLSHASGSAFDINKQRWLREFWMRKRIRVNPISIPAGTSWCSKSSSGNTSGKFVKDCKIVGLIRENNAYEAILDTKAVMSNQAIANDWKDAVYDTVDLKDLSTSILDKIEANLT